MEDSPSPWTRHPDHDPLPETAVRYAEEWHWDVVPGASVIDDGTGRRCGCATPTCPAPGAHPRFADWRARVGGGIAQIRRWWETHPDAAIVLPTGRCFDVLDVPEQAGFLALARLDRLGQTTGPVIAAATRRVQFLVLPGAREKLPDLLRRTGWGRGVSGLVCHGDGDWVVAPPSHMGFSGTARWLREPGEGNRRLPEARDVISPIAYACALATSRGR